MNFIELNKKMNHVLFHCGNAVTCAEACIKSHYIRELTAGNERLHDKFKGDTCIVLGNGPSVRDVDPSLLHGKKIITVNKMVCVPLFDQLHPVAHVTVDTKVLNEVKKDLNAKLLSSPDTDFILHRSAEHLVPKTSNVAFVYAKHLPVAGVCKVDLCRRMSIFNNVIPFAAVCAIYMGFKKIILLGCDFSFFAARKMNHFYDTDKNEKATTTLYQDLTGASIVLLQIRELIRFCQTSGIELLNATENTLLDEIPLCRLSDVL